MYGVRLPLKIVYYYCAQFSFYLRFDSLLSVLLLEATVFPIVFWNFASKFCFFVAVLYMSPEAYQLEAFNQRQRDTLISNLGEDGGAYSKGHLFNFPKSCTVST